MTDDLKISISGIRGIVGKSLSLDRLLGWVLAWEKTLPDGAVISGRDARAHGSSLVDLAVSGLEYVGREVRRAGLVPTPTVGVLVREHQAAGGFMLTASHNPSEWNALKIFNRQGEMLTPEEFERLKPIWENLPPIESYQFIPGGKTTSIEEPLTPHIDRVLAHVDSDRIAKRRMKVVVDGCCSVGGVALPKALRRAGVQVVELDCTPNGAFTRGLEPVPENIGALCARVVAEKADLGMATDPDADRLALVSEKGVPVGEELTLVLAAESVLQRGGKGVVANLSSTMLLDRVAAKYGSPIHRSKVGESHVVNLVLETGSAIGGEGSGGVILPQIHPGRDSLSGALLVLDLLAREGKSLSEKVAEYPAMYMVKDKVPLQTGRREEILSEAGDWWSDAEVDRTDGLKWTWEDRWVNLRSSNTEPILRIIAEGSNREEARDLVEEIKARLARE